VIPLFVSSPESKIKVRVSTAKDQLDRTVKTLHKAGTLHIEISEDPATLVYTSLEKELHITCYPLTPIDDIIIYAQTENHTYLEDSIKPICFRPFRESDISNGSVAVKWN
jgi:hypothetical protein